MPTKNPPSGKWFQWPPRFDINQCSESQSPDASEAVQRQGCERQAAWSAPDFPLFQPTMGISWPKTIYFWFFSTGKVHPKVWIKPAWIIRYIDHGDMLPIYANRASCAARQLIFTLQVYFIFLHLLPYTNKQNTLATQLFSACLASKPLSCLTPSFCWLTAALPSGNLTSQWTCPI